ncbi:Sec-independent protein translocase subunit TatA/TatB [Crocinitomix algicola]|uniref:Sec-independent protein translocase subunit TatA/TatB n=1 Tax=Crocinitomix algicola TaxID=1740263 RepID=UPI000831E027|nr:twin-arginine translocase TatA/TatE family subunit [Crocinitomix algicola]
MTLLFLNSIGGFELIFILLAVLMLFGAKSLPSIAKTLGKGMREIRTATDEIKRDIQDSTADFRNGIRENNPLTDIKKMIEEEPQQNEPQDFKQDNPDTSLKAPEDSQPIQNKSNKPTES